MKSFIKKITLTVKLNGKEQKFIFEADAREDKEKAISLLQELISLIKEEDKEKAEEFMKNIEKIKKAWELEKRGKKCEVCGKLFLPNPAGPEQKYCSATCRSRAWRERKRANREAKYRYRAKQSGGD